MDWNGLVELLIVLTAKKWIFKAPNLEIYVKGSIFGALINLSD